MQGFHVKTMGLKGGVLNIWMQCWMNADARARAGGSGFLRHPFGRMVLFFSWLLRWLASLYTSLHYLGENPKEHVEHISLPPLANRDAADNNLRTLAFC